MIRAIAIDDEPPALKVIESFCSRTELVDLQKTFTNTKDAQSYLKKFPVDLLFLDINMPSVSGIDFYKSLEHEIKVIFTTAYSEFAIDGFNMDAVDYLLKPYTYERFLQALQKAEKLRTINVPLEPNNEQFLFLRADYSLVKINIADIIYIEGLNDYLKVHIEHQKPVVARMTMKGILEKLPAQDFIRVHRSFIIQFKHIGSIRNKIISIGAKEIPIGSSYEEAFEKFINR